jgi:hypothetical protein
MRLGQHSVDHLASGLNTLLPRYNSCWKDPTREAMDALHLLDNDKRRE